MAITHNVRRLQREITTELTLLGRATESACICAVSKGHPLSAVLEAARTGIGDFGESYVQEAVPKFAELQGVTKHFIGHIQTNKAKAIVAGFDVVQAVDRLSAGEALAKAVQALGRGVRVLVQVNISPAERYGIPPADACRLAEALRKLDLNVDGVMAIGPLTDDGKKIRAAFEEAARCFSQIGGSTLSLGMSGDWREALAVGSTLVRLGTAIFGPRAGATTTK